MSKELDGEVKKLQKRLEKHEEKFKKVCDTNAQRVFSFMKIDQSRSKQRREYLLMGGGVAATALSFIPIVGPTVTAVVNASLSAGAAQGGQSGLIAGIQAGVQYNLVTHSSVKGFWGGDTIEGKLHNGDLGPDPRFNTFATTSSATGMLGDFIQSHLKHTGLGKGKILIPVTPSTLSQVLENYAEVIESGYAWLDQASHLHEHRLLPLVFFMMVDAIQVGGHGNLMLDTGVGLDGASELRRLTSLSGLQSSLQDLAGETGGSRIVTRLSKFAHGSSSYNSWFDTDTKEGKHLESSLCLFKSRLIAYADEYLKQMAGRMNDAFLSRICSPARALKPPALPPQFQTEGRHFHQSSFVKANGRTMGLSDHRKDYVLGMYALHAVLLQHLGTYNLGSLPPFGQDAELDARVANALIDALVTQFWITSRAYDAKSISGVDEFKLYECNLVDGNLLRHIPYIAPYFNPARVWHAQGRKLALISQQLEQVQSRIPPELRSPLFSSDDHKSLEQVVKNLTNTIRNDTYIYGNSIPYREAIRNFNDSVKRHYTYTYLKNGSDEDRLELNDAEGFLLGLLPTQKTACPGLGKRLFNELTKLYNPIVQEGPQSWLKAGVREFSQNSPGGKDPVKETSKTPHISHNKGSQHPYTPRQSSEKDEMSFLHSMAEDLRNMANMSPGNFNQIEFNKRMADALSQLIDQLYK